MNASPAGKQGAGAGGELEGGSLGTASIVFTVLAAAAPIAVIVAVVPLGIALGVGSGLPGMFVVCGALLGLFAVGYTAMSTHVVNAGAFYSYVTRGFGRPAGAGAGFVALLAYNAMAITVAASLGIFAHGAFLEVLGIDLPWWAWWAGGVAIVAFLARREIEWTAVTLGIALVCEIGILLLFDVVVLANHGFHGFSLQAFAPATVFSGTVGLGLVYAFGSFVGFEATAIYAEEAREPKRTVPRATYIALALITSFYALTTWAAISAYGIDAAPVAAAENPVLFVFAANAIEVGTLSTEIMQLLIVSSLFAGFLAFHQASARYFFSISRDGLLPKALSRTHPRFHSPHVASAVQLAIVVVVVGGLGLVVSDPYLKISAPMLGFGTLGVIVLQAITSFSVFSFFRREGDRRWLTTAICPLLAGVGLLACVYLVVDNFGQLTESDGGLVGAMPWLYLLAAAVGVGVALWLRGARPGSYRQMGANHGQQVEDEVSAAAAPALPPDPFAVSTSFGVGKTNG